MSSSKNLWIRNKSLWIGVLVLLLIVSRCASCTQSSTYEFQRRDYLRHIEYQDSLLLATTDSLTRLIHTQADSLRILNKELEKARFEAQYVRDYNNNLKNSNNNLFKIIKKQNEIIQ